MNHIERLNAILIHLQSKRIVKASEIAERFEISLRTVYRDIRALEASGVPIGAEAGVGYFLMENYKLPPVMFTKGEASALLFGEKLIEKMSDNQIKAEFCSALYKIKAILNPEEKDRLEKLHSRISVLNSNSSNENFKGKQHLSMDEFIRQQHVISDKANISLIMKTDRKKLINESKYWYGFTGEEKIDDQTCRLYFSNNELRGFASWIISSGSYARVESPEELKQILDEHLSGIIENYSNYSGLHVKRNPE